MFNLKRMRHYKGGEYLVQGHATVEATGELVVVYQSLADGKVWTRPHAEFYSMVDIEGKKAPRFVEVK